MTSNLNVGMKCIKYMLFVANFMFVMVGILLISFGSIIKSIYYDFELFMEDHYFSPATLVIAIGVIIMLIAAFGCVAAFKESTCLVNMFALMLMFALVLEVSASIAAYAMRGNIKMLLENKMNHGIDNYSKDEEIKEAVDFLQNRLMCCGVDHQEDWNGHFEIELKNSTYSRNITSRFPLSCCRWDKYPEECKPYSFGCLDRLTYIISESAVMLGTGALCIAFVQILGIAFAIMLAKSIRQLKTQQAAARWQTRQELYLQLARGAEKPPQTPVVYTPPEEPKHQVES